MRLFLTRWFSRYARRERLPEAALREAIKRAGRGLVDADLGGGLIKQRIARRGEGRSGGYRTLIAFRTNERAVFIYGFAKSELDNIDAAHLAELKRAAAVYLGLDEHALTRAFSDGALLEIKKR